MKKAAVALMLLLSLALVACSNSHKASTVHNKDNTKISLGESKSSAEKKLGVVEPDEDCAYHYDNGTLKVYYHKDKVRYIWIKGEGWYTFDGVGIGMETEALKEHFPDNNIYDPILYDKNSEITKLPGEAFTSTLIISGGLKVMSISIKYAE